jgi:hypothetical protein
MTPCDRRWQVAALHDGRLSGAERASAERHLVACAECRDEAAALASLSSALRELPAAVPDQLQLRRYRQSLLERADAAMTGRHQAIRVRRRPLVLAAAALFVLAGAGALASASRTTSPRAAATVAAAPVPATEVDVVASPEADWERETLGDEIRLTLRAGSLDVRVRRAAEGRRVLVRTPDAEIEDIGTTFHVAVDESRTRSVRVREGRVVLRRDGEPSREIAAGEEWARVEPSTVAPPAAPRTSTPPAAVPAPRSAAIPPSSPTAAPTPVASASPPEDTAGRAFAAAMSAFRAGAFDDAARQFHAFSTANAGDARAEDALYLRAIAYARLGRSGSARNAARDYLARNPSGFRAPEMRTLAE